MLVILALGNPGARYAATRHNIGWMVADAVAEALGADFRPARGEYYEAAGRIEGKDLLLVKPTTYMNNSGVAASQLIERLGITPAEMLVLVDEIQFPTGRIQLKPSGSSGGHNGIESLIYHLGTLDFPRLRCGVGSDFPPGGMADYVLGSFKEEEREAVAEMIEQGREAVTAWVSEGTARAMNKINTKPARKPDASESAAGSTRQGDGAASGPDAAESES